MNWVYHHFNVGRNSNENLDVRGNSPDVKGNSNGNLDVRRESNADCNLKGTLMGILK